MEWVKSQLKIFQKQRDHLVDPRSTQAVAPKQLFKSKAIYYQAGTKAILRTDLPMCNVVPQHIAG